MSMTFFFFSADPNVGSKIAPKKIVLPPLKLYIIYIIPPRGNCPSELPFKYGPADKYNFKMRLHSSSYVSHFSLHPFWIS